MVENVPESLWSWAGQFGFIVAGGIMVFLAVLAWTGKWRDWASAQPSGLALINLNFFPFSAGLFGLGLVCFGLSANAEFGLVPGTKQAYDWIGVTFCVLSLLSGLWWPKTAAPGWHRDWLAWGGPDETDPWPTDEEREEGRR